MMQNGKIAAGPVLPVSAKVTAELPTRAARDSSHAPSALEYHHGYGEFPPTDAK
ncbi:MAG: hypothetical protein JWM27_150 [Gemmatimonadetes bacterium]|nr:hypothetical protein [Gemmatimonadota bacterium]